MEQTFVVAGNSKLAVYRSGASSDGPVVVCDSGLGGNHQAWDGIIERLGDEVTVVTYDRAGYGASDGPHDRRHLHDLARDLVSVCDATAANRPVVLVGHSLGGRIARAATALLPAERVAGLVLIEGAPDNFPAEMPRVDFAQRTTFRVFGWLSRVGAMRTRFVREKLATTMAASPESAILDGMIRDMNRNDFWIAARGEWASMRDPMAPAVPPKQVVALIGDGWSDWKDKKQPRFGAGASDLLAQIRRGFESQYPQGRVILVKDTSHRIPNDQPDVVTATIREVLDGAE